MINDYELIYLVQSEQDEIALKRLINKYGGLIYKNIYKSYNKSYEHDDLYQEALILMNYVILHFDENKNKTFTKYFELVLKRLFVRLSYKNNKYVLNEDLGGILAKNYPEFDYYEEGLKLRSYLESLTDLESLTFKLYYQKNLKPAQISELLNLDIKKIYNVLYRLKRKSKPFEFDL